MKTFSLALLALISLSVAQFDGPPNCATDCASKFLASGIGNCGRDAKCICANDSFIGDISCCLIEACGPADVSKAITFAQQICTAAGVSVPNEASCSTTATSASKTSGVTTATESGTMNIQTSTPTTDATTSQPTGSAANTAGSSSATTGTTSNPGPRVTAGPVLGALGGLVAVAAML